MQLSFVICMRIMLLELLKMASLLCVYYLRERNSFVVIM